MAPPSMAADQEGAVTRDDVREVTRAIEGLSRRLDDVKREFERRGRNPP
jgi:predicted transcriptional regulator